MDKMTAPFVLFGTPDLDSNQAVRDKLRHRGTEVSACASPQEFLEIARRRPPDVVVLDDDLETVGGQVLIRLLRMLYPQVPIILLLPAGTLPDRDAHRHLGPVCSLVSPVSEQDLFIVIDSALQGRGSSQPAAARPVIFCVDDDPLFLKSLVRLLRRRDYSVIGYENPDSALEGVPIHKPSLVFIDVLMPGMSGLDLATELREAYGDKLPFVLLTARSDDTEIEKGYRSGARYYITKPCEPERILNIADYLVGDLGPRERELLGSKL
jgi:DNA-binding response OmpR family regulator